MDRMLTTVHARVRRYTGPVMHLRLPALVVAIFSTTSASVAPPPPATPVTNAEDRAIFDEELSREKWGFMFRLPTRFWSPSPADVTKMEERLPDYLREQLSPPPT